MKALWGRQCGEWCQGIRNLVKQKIDQTLKRLPSLVYLEQDKTGGLCRTTDPVASVSCLVIIQKDGTQEGVSWMT